MRTPILDEDVEELDMMWCDVVDKAERLIAEAASQGSQLAVFPEAFVGGYPRGNTFGAVIGSRSAKGREDYRKYHASAIDVPGQSSSDLPDWNFCTRITYARLWEQLFGSIGMHLQVRKWTG